MSNLTKTRRMPVAYRLRPGGITEICYSTTPQPIVADGPMPEVRLPGTRWLEVRRAREQRLAAAPVETSLVKNESWAEKISNAARRLAQRQSAWFASLRGAQAPLELSPQD